MWSYKGGNLDTGIFDEDKITNEITGIQNGKFKLSKDADNTRKAIMKLRSLMGARKYMRHERIAKIFGEQVNQILHGTSARYWLTFPLLSLGE
jgi:hypothetical protein